MPTGRPGEQISLQARAYGSRGLSPRATGRHEFAQRSMKVTEALREGTLREGTLREGNRRLGA